jgi:hypothetical protein
MASHRQQRRLLLNGCVSLLSLLLLLLPPDPHPGNVAVDAVNGGRLIYYDFGMMGSIPGGVRGGLMELFYGVYERDADRWGGLFFLGVGGWG